MMLTFWLCDWKSQSVLVSALIQDYLWMKDYLQLDGIVFKLVPIKTPILKMEVR
jgi:hypothetical protein